MIGVAPARTDIVLVGGGHAHVQVLTAFATRPLPGVPLTLITRDLKTAYSGMLPGIVAGHYRPDVGHIDLERLTTATGARLVHAEAAGLDRTNKRVLLSDGTPVSYDIVSLDIGIAPALAAIPGAAEHAIPVKPIGQFLERLDRLLAHCNSSEGPRRIAMIGGGAGGVELLLSIRARVLAEAEKQGQDRAGFSFTLVTAGEILQTHNQRVRAAFRRILSARGIALHEHRRVRALAAGAIEFEAGSPLEADATLVATEGAASAWFAGTGLARDAGGFVAVGPTLQTLDDPDVFAAGDCAAMVETPRQKAGVYAVRAGPPLAENLRRRARGEALKAWTPQRHHLALISTGERYAVASWGRCKAEGAWLWTLKDWIDRRWMRKYQTPD